MELTGQRGGGDTREQPPLPVRRLHNFIYCPRLCYLQWVEDVFVENADTVAGSATHRNVDQPTVLKEERRDTLAAAIPEGGRLRSLHLSSEKLHLTGIVDLVEGGSEGARIVDYKRGSARRGENGERRAKEYDAVQIVAQALLLEEAGVAVEGGSIYYAADRRHVSVELTQELRRRTRKAIEEALALCHAGRMPPPLVDDARCDYCSAYPVCLPRETTAWAARRAESLGKGQLELAFPESADMGEETCEGDGEGRNAGPPRAEREGGEVLVLQQAGTQVGRRGGEFVVSQRKAVVRKLPLRQVRAIYIYGAVQLTAQAAQSCLEEDIPVAYFTGAGRYLGALHGLPASGVDARLGQYAMFQQDFWQVKLARECVRAKIHNQRVMLMRNGKAGELALKVLARMARKAAAASSLEEIRGIEGGAAAIYFREFATMLKASGKVRFDFSKRNRRPPRDAVNALLSLGYSVLAKELAGMCHVVGLDPFFGFFHRPRYGRPALALDLMEEFRPLIADSVAISLINRREVEEEDFTFSTRGVTLKESGRRRFWEAWFRRLDSEVKHPEFGYRMSYRRMMEIQARQLWRFTRGEAGRYHGFTTR